DPALALPVGERLGRVDAEIVELPVGMITLGELRPLEPARRELIPAIPHVLAPEHAEMEHLRGGQLRLELRIEILPRPRDHLIAIAMLHPVVHGDEAPAPAHPVPLPLLRLGTMPGSLTVPRARRSALRLLDDLICAGKPRHPVAPVPALALELAGSGI